MACGRYEAFEILIQSKVLLHAGMAVAFDSSCTWETGMQGYVVGVQHLQATLEQPVPPPSVRHLYCDLAVRYANSLTAVQARPKPCVVHYATASQLLSQIVVAGQMGPADPAQQEHSCPPPHMVLEHC